MRVSLRTLTRDWKLKLAALTLAVLLWVVVSAEQVTTQWVPVSVRVVPRDAGWVVERGPLPREVEVRFAGPGRELWELALEDPVLVVHVYEAGAESRFLALDPRMVRVPAGLVATPQEVRPARVRVQLRRRVSAPAAAPGGAP